MGKWTILRQRLHEAWLYRYGYKWAPRCHQRYIEKLRQRQTPVRVVFFVLNISMWKYQGLHDLLRRDERFKVYTVLSPGLGYQTEQQLRDLRQMRQYFSDRQIDYIDWQLENGAPPTDIRKTINPDIVVYMQPYHGVYHPLHCFLKFTDRLILYTPYSFVQAQDPYNYDNVMQNIAWKQYFPTDCHIDDARRLARNKGVNMVAAGYASADEFLLHPAAPSAVCPAIVGSPDDTPWLDKPHTRRRLIWAPHCTLANDGSVFSRSNFLMMADYMVQLAQRHTNDLQIAFKPHPGLLTELYKHADWGRERADAYYQLWRQMPNTQLADGPFVELFRGSDAMVHDSGSFVVDYLYFNRPVMYVTRDIQRAKSFVNLPGKEAYDAHYVGATLDDVEHFVDDVVLAGHDTMTSVRQAFFDRFLARPNGKTVAENMYQDILTSLF